MNTYRLLLVLFCFSILCSAEAEQGHEQKSRPKFISGSIIKAIRDRGVLAIPELNPIDQMSKDEKKAFIEECMKAVPSKAVLNLNKDWLTRPNEEPHQTGCQIKEVESSDKTPVHLIPIRPIIEIGGSEYHAMSTALQKLCEKGYMPDRAQKIDCEIVPKEESPDHNFFQKVITCLGKTDKEFNKIIPSFYEPYRCTATTYDNGKEKLKTPVTIQALNRIEALKETREAVCRQGIEYSRLLDVDIICSPTGKEKSPLPPAGIPY